MADNIDKLEEFIEGAAESTTKIYQKLERMAAYRTEASRLASMANKRVKRLETKNLTDSPAYKKYIDEGGVKFSVAGKSHNELQSEVARMRRFVNSKTSTIRGYNKTLKEMAENTGIKYKNVKELRSLGPKFFELSSKVEQYLRTVEDMGSALGYQQIWSAVNEYVKNNQIDLGSAEANIDQMTHSVGEALRNFESPTELPNGEWWKLTDFDELK